MNLKTSHTIMMHILKILGISLASFISLTLEYAVDANINPRCLAAQANIPPIINGSCTFTTIEGCQQFYSVPRTGTMCSDVVALTKLNSVDELVGLNPGVDCQNILFKNEVRQRIWRQNFSLHLHYRSPRPAGALCIGTLDVPECHSLQQFLSDTS